MRFKVGDIVVHKLLGLLCLELAKPRLSTNPLFTARRLMGDGEHLYYLYESSLDKMRPASDEDIVNELIYELSTTKIGNKTVTLTENSVIIYELDDYIDLTWDEFNQLMDLS